MKLDKKDIQLLDAKGISEEQLDRQLAMIASGFPPVHIDAAATVGSGIMRPTDEEAQRYSALWDTCIASGAKVVKMVPASGAASRMFKNVFAFINSSAETPDTDFMKAFFARITDFAFFPLLNKAAMRVTGKSVLSLIAEGRFREVAQLLVSDEGLGYGNMPKALLEFHKVMGGTRTPLEEQLAEGAQYAAGNDGIARVHFTISPEHLAAACAKVEEVCRRMEREYGVKFDISFSIQKPSTDTVAAAMDGSPYREDGSLFFRPGGHGALIENLNDLDADFVFLKNIDNVVPDSRRGDTVAYKKVLGGVLAAVKQQIDRYCSVLDNGTPSPAELAEMLAFARETLCITHDGMETADADATAGYLRRKFNRPVRVCGMVVNEGEPGGGPFLARNPDGTVSPQILESSQIDMTDSRSAEIARQATHFNPVDLVCAIRDFHGVKFNLPDYVDPQTGFISQKSRGGVEIKALELPGLWNGAMSDWNTVFVEVPASTFNPVKTVNDLLRDTHQPANDRG